MKTRMKSFSSFCNTLNDCFTVRNLSSHTTVMTKTGESHPTDVATVLKNLGVRSPSKAINVLETLLEQNIVTPSQVKDAVRAAPKQKNATPIPYMTRHIALRFHYDGSTYNGLAQNINSPTDNSVEKKLIAAMKKTCLIESRDTCGYSRSGRTDKGVSAFGQVIALRVRSAFPIGTLLEGEENEKTLMQEVDLPKNHLETIKCWAPAKPMKKKGNAAADKDSEDPQNLAEKILKERDFAQMLNNILPHSIRVVGWSPVTDGFSARFSTKSRTYRYFFVRRHLDLDAMAKGMQYMVGKHDFRNLCKMNCEEVDNFMRIVNYGKIVKAKPLSESTGVQYEDHVVSDDAEDSSDLYRQVCYFEIQGQAFLWHQIRCIASLLFMIGKKLEKAEVVNQLFDIESNPGKPCYPFAADLPLVLHKCDYHNVRFGHSVQNLWKTSCDLESKWEAQVLAAEQLKNGVASLGDETEVHKDDVIEFVKSIFIERARKQNRRRDIFEDDQDRNLPEPFNDQGIMKWTVALDYIFKHTGLSPTGDGPMVQVHVPLMKRGRGTTYEEKVNAILTDPDDGKGTKKRKRNAYESNIKTKKVSKEECKAFYTHMATQGGSGL